MPRSVVTSPVSMRFGKVRRGRLGDHDRERRVRRPRGGDADPHVARDAIRAPTANRTDTLTAMARADIDRRAMAALSSGHMAVDFAGGVLPALLPFLVTEWDLSYTYAGGLILASALAGSVVQPLFGLWSDRRGAVWLLPAGVAIGAVGMGLAALSPSYWWVVLFVVVSGLGTAAYHPEGSKFAAYVSGARRASGMSLFSIGGNLGYSLGVIVTTPIVVALGIEGGALVVLPCLAVAAVLLWLVPFLLTFVPDDGATRRGRLRGRTASAPWRCCSASSPCAASRGSGCITFVPLWEVSIGNSEGYGNFLLSIMLLAGAAGTLMAGPAADRFGRRPVLLVSNVIVPPAIAVFILSGGVAARRRARRHRRRRRRHVRRDDGDEPGVHAAAHRHGVGPLDRPVDRPGRHRSRVPRRDRRRGRPRDGALGVRRGPRDRRGADVASAADGSAPSSRSGDRVSVM